MFTFYLMVLYLRHLTECKNFMRHLLQVLDKHNMEQGPLHFNIPNLSGKIEKKKKKNHRGKKKKSFLKPLLLAQS